jgi:Zn-dependent protease with chaperone function
MIDDAAALFVLAVLLAGPVPAALARAAWPVRDPVVALLCWQSLGLAGGLSLIGAPLVLGLDPWGDSLLTAASAFFDGRAAVGVAAYHWLALGLAAVLAVRLVWVLISSGIRITRVQARNRALLRIVTREGRIADAGPLASRVNIVDVADMVAFCLPGGPPMIVVSAAVVSELDEAELEAVVAHERVHLSERHHLFLLPFVAWQRALPMVPATRQASIAVHDLVEMRADDRAAAVAGRTVLARAIARVGSAVAVPGGALAIAATGVGITAIRVARLLEQPRPLSLWGRVVALGCSVALVLVPTGLLLIPGLGRVPGS